MARNVPDNRIYSATYSNVPVYEYNVDGNHVMRRRSDDWINATHILKVAGYDKPTRTRILEREVQKGTHEKVQGGYGKYQGTWIELKEGRDLAAKNGVLDRLLPIFDFIPGEHTPPPAPKHITAASSKPRAPRAAPQPRRQLAYSQMPQEYEQIDGSLQEHATPDVDMFSESAYDEFENGNLTGSRKRRRVEDRYSQADKVHQLWAEELLDYFMLQDNPLDSLPSAPEPPQGANLDRPIDDKGHTALHWAAAMGDVEVVKDLIDRGANIESKSKTGETPLMRAVQFTNSFDRLNMEKLASMLISTVSQSDWNSASTVFHHIADTTARKSKYACARYYMDCLLNKMAEVATPGFSEEVINAVDSNGDTAVTIAARNGARKCVRSLIGRNAAVDTVNKAGETADHLIVQLNSRRQERMTANRQLSSSPYQPDSVTMSRAGGAVKPPNGLHFGLSASQASAKDANSLDIYKSESALLLTSQIIPTFFEKAKNLAASLDAEISEKDAELHEAERLANMRRTELDDLRHKQEQLRRKETDDLGDVLRTNDELLQELEELTRQCEGLTAAEEDQKLRQIYKEELAKRMNQEVAISMTDGEAPELMREKLQIARELSAALKTRQQLIEEIVQAASVAGVGDMHSQYHRLLSGCLNLREEDVQGMLPEIVEELQQWRELEGKGA